MFSTRTWGLSAPVMAIAAAFAFAGPASADIHTQDLGCEGTVATVTPLTGILTPTTSYIAHSTISPCDTDHAGSTVPTTVGLGTLTSLLGGNLSLGAVAADTRGEADSAGKSASSLVSVAGVSVPTPGGTISIPGPEQASASYACVNGALQAASSSTLRRATIGGQTISLPTDGSADTIPLTNALGLPVGQVTFNEHTVTDTGHIEDLADIQLPGIANIVIGQARVTKPSDVTDSCRDLSTTAVTTVTGTAGTVASVAGTVASTVEGLVCPAGTTLIPASQVCAIVNGTTASTGTTGTGGAGGSGGAGGAGGSGSTVTVVRADSNQVIGGQIISLRQARQRYRSACLKGAGPNYVVVGTNRADTIIVNHARMRVLALGGNDTVVVRGGNGTCVDGGAGNDRVMNMGSNRVAIYGGSGANRIRVGNGPALITAGNGDNQIVAGTGRDVITVGTGRNQITARGPRTQVRAAGRRTIAHLPSLAARYAEAHGVHRVFLLHG